MRKKISFFLFSILVISFSFSSLHIRAQEDEALKKQPVKYKKARALQASTAKKMAKVNEALEVVDDKGETAPDMETVTRILTELRNDKDELKSYDRSVMWNAWAYVYFSSEKYTQAMDAYRKLIAEPEVTIPLRTGALLSLGQLYMVQEDYERGIQYVLQWQKEIEKVTAQSYALLGQAYRIRDSGAESTCWGILLCI